MVFQGLLAEIVDLNVQETECMVTSKKREGPVCHLESQGESIKQVNTFKYLR